MYINNSNIERHASVYDIYKHLPCRPPVAVQVIVDLTQERDYLSSQQTLEVCRNLSMSSPERGLDAGVPNGGGTALSASGLSKEERQHLSVELADTKAKLRRYRQELYVVFSLCLFVHTRR